MAKLSDVQIAEKCKNIESRIKQQNNVYRADIQDIINRIINSMESLPELERQIKSIVNRAGVKEFGNKTFYQPRATDKDLRREDYAKEDITFKFIEKGELLTFLKVKERFNIGE